MYSSLLSSCSFFFLNFFFKNKSGLQGPCSLFISLLFKQKPPLRNQGACTTKGDKIRKQSYQNHNHSILASTIHILSYDLKRNAFSYVFDLYCSMLMHYSPSTIDVYPGGQQVKTMNTRSN